MTRGFTRSRRLRRKVVATPQQSTEGIWQVQAADFHSIPEYCTPFWPRQLASTQPYLVIRISGGYTLMYAYIPGGFAFTSIDSGIIF